MTKIADQVVQEDSKDEYDTSILKKPAFPVNLRLYRTSMSYRQIIMDCVNYLESHLNMTFEDYHGIRGISGPELGLPWSMIAFKQGNKKKFCFNPRIIGRSEEVTETETKCGALKMDKGIKVNRHNLIDLEYYDLKGEKIVERNIGRHEGGFTIQHEVDHCYGISIRHREIK